MKKKSRKVMRKEMRKAKKLKKHEYYLKINSKKKQTKMQKNQGNLKKDVADNKKSTGMWKGREETIPKRKDVNEAIQKPKSEKKTIQKMKSGKKTISKPAEKSKEFKNLQERGDYERKLEQKRREKLNKEFREQRIRQLKLDNTKEDMEIKKIEKKLKMKGKSKSFALDGLDYLLDICDKSLSQNELEQNLHESESEFESDLENIVGDAEKGHKTKRKKITADKNNKSSINEEDEEISEESDVDDEEMENSEFEDDEEDSGSEIGVPVRKETSNKPIKRQADDGQLKTKNKKVKFDDRVIQEDDDDESDMSEDEDDEMSEKGVKEKSAEITKMWEDIYGRTRDEKGNVIKTYTPPQLRKKVDESGDEKNSEKLARLKKQLKGLLNRLAESNMSYVSNQIEQLYMSNSRNDMNTTLCNLFSESLMTEVLTPERLIAEHAMLIAVLHSNIGSEIGAHFLQYAVTEFSKILQNNPPVEDKQINNILLFIMHLYNFQLVHSKLMYDIVNELLKNLEEKQIELLLMTLRTVGFNLRKDDPIALKALVLSVQKEVNSISPGDNGSRLKFMLDMLMAIKNNNMSKIPNYNPEYVEGLRKKLKLLLRKGNYSTELNISLQDLLNAEQHGRWWIVGSAWSGAAPTQPGAANPEDKITVSTEFSQKLLNLAKQQRMNTDVRRNVFCILMSAEDFLEAFEKLIKLKLKGAVEREIMNVLLHCALHEKKFNPYYFYLANKFCVFDRKYQMMLQCAVWDKIKELKNLLPLQITVLAKFLGNVILEKGLPISVLKVIQFSELDKPTIKFMRQVLLTILVGDDRNAAVAVFKRIADSAKLKLFRESLRLFLQHFVLKNTKNLEEEKVTKVVEMVKVAEQTLTSSDSKIEF